MSETVETESGRRPLSFRAGDHDPRSGTGTSARVFERDVPVPKLTAISLDTRGQPRLPRETRGRLWQSPARFLTRIPAEGGPIFTAAMGSASEVEYHLFLARDLGYIPRADHDRLSAAVTEVKQMLASLIRKLAESRRT